MEVKGFGPPHTEGVQSGHSDLNNQIYSTHKGKLKLAMHSGSSSMTASHKIQNKEKLP